MMTQKPYRKALCFLYILILLLWGVSSGVSSVSEIAEAVCDGQECYVNQNSAIQCYVNHNSVITSAARHLPAQEYLSVRSSNTSETLSAAGGRGQRHSARSVRQIAAHLLCNHASSKIHALSGLLLVHEIPAHSSCSIIITNYLHLKDGQKS